MVVDQMYDVFVVFGVDYVFGCLYDFLQFWIQVYVVVVVVEVCVYCVLYLFVDVVDLWQFECCDECVDQLFVDQVDVF